MPTFTWIRHGEALASQAHGFLGSGLLQPPPGDDNWQILFRFAIRPAWTAGRPARNGRHGYPQVAD
jgi:antibiotic biosynthesis monooxygenase (ABM) superfamily enzyme